MERLIPSQVNWLDRFLSKQGMGACFCEGQEINAAVAEIESLRAKLAQLTPSQSEPVQAILVSDMEETYCNNMGNILGGFKRDIKKVYLIPTQPTPSQSQDVLERKLVSIIKWLETNQPDVFRRGLWEAIDVALKGAKK